jgi:hypothetical protein
MTEREALESTVASLRADLKKAQAQLDAVDSMKIQFPDDFYYDGIQAPSLDGEDAMVVLYPDHLDKYIPCSPISIHYWKEETHPAFPDLFALAPRMAKALLRAWDHYLSDFTPEDAGLCRTLAQLVNTDKE